VQLIGSQQRILKIVTKLFLQLAGMWYIYPVTNHLNMSHFVSTQAQLRQLETRNLVRKHNSDPIVYKRFAASKVSDHVKPMTVVEFTDLLGRKHRIPVRNKKMMREAQEFLAIFKREVSDVNAIINEYPMSYGKVAPEFAADCVNELLAYGLSEELVKRIIGY